MAYTFKHGDRPLDGLTVQRAVGRGGFGEVYYALADSGKQVALKYLRENPEVELRGIAQVMNLKSPYLITIYDVRQNDAGEPFVIMEYVSGPSLRDMFVAEPKGMSVEKAAFLFEGIAKGLAYLHERGIVHRDLKPANIFYDDGYVKIGDYGLSKHISVSKHSGQTVSVGTVHYMAPEIGSGSYTKAIDIYALGVILYEMLTGQLPFTGSSMGEVLMRHLRDEPDVSGVPAPFAPIIAKALAKDPNDRYQDADEMLAAIMDVAELSSGAASFDASALTQVPRADDAHDDATLTSPAHVPVPPPPPPPMDAREAHPLPPRLQKKLDRLTRKMEAKAGKLERRFGQARHAQPHGGGHRGWGQGKPGPVPRAVGRKRQLAVLAIVAFGISLLLGLLTGHREGWESAPLFGMMITAFVVGPLITDMWLLRGYPARNTVFDRLAYATVAGFLCVPVIVIAADEFSVALARVVIGPAAMLLLCNWTKRIEEGRQGTVDGWGAFWPALVGLIAVSIANDGQYNWIGAGLCATIAVLTQAVAALWPLSRVAGEVHLPGPGPRGGLGQPRPAPPVAPSEPARPEAHRSAMDGAGRESSPPPSAPAPAPSPSMPNAAPSFASRKSSPGLGILGKFLLLVGVLIAVSDVTVREPLSQRIETNNIIVNPNIAWVVHNGVPPAAVILPLGLGSLLLVLSRRHDGGVHFLRGVLGCGLLLWGVLAGMVSAAGGAMQILLTSRDWSALEQDDVYVPLAFMGILVGLGLLLLLWPRPQRDRPIVI